MKSSPQSHTFEDVSIVHFGTYAIPSFAPALATVFRKVVKTETIQWTKKDSYKLLNSNKTLLKTGTSSWDIAICSQQLTNTITYVQLKIVALNAKSSIAVGGIFFGITTSVDIEYPVNHRDKTIYIYNNANVKSTKIDEDLIIYSSNVYSTGDVMGMVVDLDCDQIRFYKNGKYVAKSSRKPSKFQPMYAMLWLYYETCEIETGDFFPYSALEPHHGAIPEPQQN
jgi:hypothetical protein